MKIQELAIIFVIIILPISILLSEYTQFQIKTINTQTVYDAKLTSATYDAIRAFQLNSTNNSNSDLANSKIRDLEASINSFRNSIMTAFKLNGYTENALNNYIPALVYTLYDGFYIYSPYKNVVNESGKIIDNPLNQESIYGLKPYISYSCRYKYPLEAPNPTIDVVITYALDNYITVQGFVKGEYVNKSGYLVDNVTAGISGEVGSEKYSVTYNGVEINGEQLREYLPIAINGLAPKKYPYVKINGTKYYLIEDYLVEKNLEGIEITKDCIISVGNSKPFVQCKEGEEQFIAYKGMIMNNESAIRYYRDAKTFTDWFKNSGLQNLKYENAYDEVISEDDKVEINYVWPNDDRIIFDFNTETGPISENIENELSEFNQHRLAVIRNKIEINLAIAISNYNSYSKAKDNVFQMPELKEEEWGNITKNISMISFLQGLYIGGKTYNGYAIVNNTESKEVVLEEDIYILGKDDGKYNYYKIGDKGLENGDVEIDASIYGEKISAGRLKQDFRKKGVTEYNQGYVENGLIRHYEASNGYGYTNGAGQKIWKDLSGHKDAIVEGISEGQDDFDDEKKCIVLDGVNDWINLGDTHSDCMTIEAVIELPYDNPNSAGKGYILNNHQGGGIGILLEDGSLGHSTYINDGTTKREFFDKNIPLNNENRITFGHREYYISLKYDGNNVIMNLYDYNKGKLEKIISAPVPGKLRKPSAVNGNETVMAMAANPMGNGKDSTSCFKMNVYSVRIYDRALSENEIDRNIETFKESMEKGFEEKEIINTTQGTYSYYPLKKYDASYDSVVMQNNVTTYDDIYQYVSGQNTDLKTAFYTALGRERYSAYKSNNTAMQYFNVLVVGTMATNTSADPKTFMKRTYDIFAELSEDREFNVSFKFDRGDGAAVRLANYIRENKENYNLIIVNSYVWTQQIDNEVLTDAANTANLITIGNDIYDLDIIKSGVAGPKCTIDNITITPEGTKALGDVRIDPIASDTQAHLYFDDDVDVFFTGNYHGEWEGNAHIIGALDKGKYRWVHSQVALGYRENKNDMNVLKALIKYALQIK